MNGTSYRAGENGGKNSRSFSDALYRRINLEKSGLPSPDPHQVAKPRVVYYHGILFKISNYLILLTLSVEDELNNTNSTVSRNHFSCCPGSGQQNGYWNGFVDEKI